MRANKFIAVILTMLVPMLSIAQAPLEFSLQEAQDYAIKNNVNIKNALADKGIAKMRALEIISTGLPNLSASLNYQNTFQLPVSLVPAVFFDPTAPDDEFAEISFGTQHNSTLSFNGSQLLIDGRYFIGLRVNKSIIAVSETSYELTESDIRKQVAQAYYAGLVAQKSKQLVMATINTLSQLLKETQALYDNGFAEELEVDRLKLSLANLQSELANAEMQVEVSQNLLKYQMGLQLEQDILLTDSLEALLLKETINEIPSFDYTSRLEYRLLELQHTIRGYEVRSIYARYMPSLSFFAGYDFNAQREQFNFFDFNEPWFESGYFGLQLSVPIFDGLNANAVAKQKKYEQTKLMNQLLDFEQQSKLQVSNASANYKQALANYENQKQNLALAEKIYTKVKIKYQEGVGSSLELANAESNLNQSRGNYVEAMYNLLITKTDLDKALGLY